MSLISLFWCLQKTPLPCTLPSPPAVAQWMRAPNQNNINIIASTDRWSPSLGQRTGHASNLLTRYLTFVVYQIHAVYKLCPAWYDKIPKSFTALNLMLYLAHVHTICRRWESINALLDQPLFTKAFTAVLQTYTATALLHHIIMSWLPGCHVGTQCTASLLAKTPQLLRPKHLHARVPFPIRAIFKV